MFTTRAFADDTVTVSTDGPIKSIAKAIADADPAKPVTIQIAPGTYELDTCLKLPARTAPLTIESSGNGDVILSGGSSTGPWKSAQLDDRTVWTADVPAARIGIWNFHELWVGGRRANPSRYPEHGTLPVVAAENKQVPWNTAQDHFEFRRKDLPPKIPDGVDAIVYDRWTESRLPIVKLEDGSITSSRTTVYQLQPPDRFYLEGAVEWVKNPGDWALDRKAGMLYYMPRPGETIDKTTATAPHLPALLRFDHGDHVAFRGITFSYSEWNLPNPVIGGEKQRGGFGQADVGVPAAVTLERCHDCRFEHCTFTHIGSYAVAFGTGCHDCVLDHCTMTDLAAGGVKIGETDIRRETENQTFNNTVTDCRITDGGHGYTSGCGIWIGQSYGNTISHNEIADLDCSGISVGWTWGYGDSLAKDNKIEFNLIHHLGKRSDGTGPLISDLGGIYLLGLRGGTIVHGNVVHDVTARDYGGWGIYLDEGPTDVMIDGNLVYRCSHGGINQHYGQRNTVRNCVLVDNGDAQITRTMDEAPNSLKFDHNILSWNRDRLTNTGSHGCSFDFNLYHCVKPGKLVCGNDSWETWKAAGQDAHTVLGDPHFVDPARDNYTVSANSPARKMGIDPPDPAAAGPRR